MLTAWRAPVAQRADWWSWSQAAVNRVIPNLLDVRTGRLNLALSGDAQGCEALLQRIGRLIGQPFERRLPLQLAHPAGWEGWDRAAAFASLFEPRFASGFAARGSVLGFLALPPGEVELARVEAQLAALSSAGGLLVLPGPTVPEQRLALGGYLLQCGWLPCFVDHAPSSSGTGRRRKPAAGSMTLDTERLARIIHELFLENAWTRGERLGTTPALHPWRRLDATYRHANRSQAEHIACKLAWSGLIATAGSLVADGSREPLWSRPEFIEPLARMEHDRWASDRILDGWVHGAIRDNAARRHPDLIPYEALSEEAREKDRVAVATIPFILQLADYGWRTLTPVRLAGDWPQAWGQTRWPRRWRRDLAHAAEERAPAVLEFWLDPREARQHAMGRFLNALGFPIVLCRPEGRWPDPLTVPAADVPGLLCCLNACRRVVWERPQTPLLEAMVAERGRLRIERAPPVSS